jgi:Spy/CpxP family protein refolding chaperone
MNRRRVCGVLAGVGAAVILGGVALAAATQAGGELAAMHGAGHGESPGLMVPGLVPHALLGRMAGELGLTPEQRQTIQGMFDQARPGFEQLHRQVLAGSELLARTAPDDGAYQTVVASVSQQAADAAAEFVLQASQLRSQVNGVLTPAQRTRLGALEADLGARMLERHHHDHRVPPAAATAPQGLQ